MSDRGRNEKQIKNNRNVFIFANEKNFNFERMHGPCFSILIIRQRSILKQTHFVFFYRLYRAKCRVSKVISRQNMPLNNFGK